MLFFFVRHGHPIYTPDRLTAIGRAQAQALGDRMAVAAPEHIFASSSNRAIETAMPSCERLGLTPEILDWANEKYAAEQMTVDCADGKRHWCFVDGPTVRRFNEPDVVDAGRRWIELPEYKDTDLAKGFLRIQKEADGLLASLGFTRDGAFYTMTKQPAYKRVALFAHEGFGRAFLSSVLGIPYPMFATHFAINYTSLTVIEFDESGEPAPPRVLTFGNDGHLLKNGDAAHILHLRF